MPAAPSPSARRRRSSGPSSSNWLLDIALDHLTLGRAALYAAILEGSIPRPLPRAHSQHAVAGLRRAGQQRLPSPRPPHPRLAAESRPARAPAPRARRATWTKPGKSPSAAPCNSSWPTSTSTAPASSSAKPVSLGIPRRRSRRRARAHREMRLRAAQGGAGGCRAGDWRGRRLTPSWPPPS